MKSFEDNAKLKIWGKLITLYILSSISSLAFAQVTHKDLSQKDIFKNEFPKTIVFRGEYVGSVHTNCNVWSNGLIHSDGVFKKYVSWDEHVAANPVTRDWVSQYAKDNPEKLMLIHYNFREHRNDQPGVSDLFSPAHRVTFSGTNLSADIDASTTAVSVNKASLFNLTYPDGSFRYPCVLIVALDGNGNRLWDQSEIVLLKSVDIDSNVLTVEREHALTTAKAYFEGTYIAPISTRLGNSGVFDVNLSESCPVIDGKTAADVILDQLKAILTDNDALIPDLQGISYDVLKWKPRFDFVDTNNDGISDGGIINGEDKWRNGAIDLLARIREAFSEDKYVLTCDGWEHGDQRSLNLLNGMESEGLISNQDAYRAFSTPINTFTFWQERCTSDYKLNYVATKVKNSIDIPNEDNYIRFASGTATCLGVAFTRWHQDYDPVKDEIIAGTENKTHWLGQPMGGMIRLAKNAPDELDGAGVDLTSAFMTGLQGVNCSVIKDGNSIVVTGNQGSDHCELKINDLRLGQANKDLTIYFEIEEVGNAAAYPIPRIVEAHMDGLPSYEETSTENEMHNGLYGFFTVGPATQMSLYYRKAGGRNLDLTLDIEGAGSVRIKNFTVHAHTQAIAREFENGAVLVNPSLDEMSFNLRELFPDFFFKKIDGVSHPDYNDGSYLGGTVAVPPKNALFIQKFQKEKRHSYLFETEGDCEGWSALNASLSVKDGSLSLTPDSAEANVLLKLKNLYYMG